MLPSPRRCEKLVFAIIPETGEDILGFGSLFRFGRISPKHGRGIADLDAMAAVLFKKTVQSGRVGEGRRLRDRRIVSLLMPIGREGIEIERDDGRTGRLRSPDALDSRMQASDRRMLRRKRGRSLPLCLPRPRAVPKELWRPVDHGDIRWPCGRFRDRRPRSGLSSHLASRVRQSAGETRFSEKPREL